MTLTRTPPLVQARQDGGRPVCIASEPHLEVVVAEMVPTFVACPAEPNPEVVSVPDRVTTLPAVRRQRPRRTQRSAQVSYGEPASPHWPHFVLVLAFLGVVSPFTGDVPRALDIAVLARLSYGLRVGRASGGAQGQGDSAVRVSRPTSRADTSGFCRAAL
jgi:hypothetical protein